MPLHIMIHEHFAILGLAINNIFCVCTLNFDHNIMSACCHDNHLYSGKLDYALEE